jgi:hypothetical protein
MSGTRGRTGQWDVGGGGKSYSLTESPAYKGKELLYGVPRRNLYCEKSISRET